MPDDTVPPTSLPPDISLILAGFHTLVPGGGVKTLPYFQVFILNGPWLTAPAGAISLALLSTPAGAAIGNSFCCASAAVTDTQTVAHAAAIAMKSLIIVSSATFWSARYARPVLPERPNTGGHRMRYPTIVAGPSGRSKRATAAPMEALGRPTRSRLWPAPWPAPARTPGS